MLKSICCDQKSRMPGSSRCLLNAGGGRRDENRYTYRTVTGRMLFSSKGIKESMRAQGTMGTFALTALLKVPPLNSSV